MNQTDIDRVQLALNPLRNDPALWSDAYGKFAASGIRVVSGMYEPIGEDYTSLESIHATGGLLPDATWDSNWSCIQRCLVLAQYLSIKDISLHAGFIPPAIESETYNKLIQRIRRIADLIADLVQGTLLLETGQESADQLLAFLDVVGRDNIAINFDPANMILYNTGDPIDALAMLMPKVRQVHIKDARYPTAPGLWGQELPAGQGEVDWHRFMKLVRENGYAGEYIIEREAGEDRVADIITAARLLRSIH
ncbi:MAG: sugar phosphate isomerase/epimerase family protein [Phycisphaerales bacterium]